MATITFALNHMTVPRLPLPGFFALARRLGLQAVEIRNDLAGVAIADGMAPGDMRSAAAAAGVEIVSINALYPFNMWDAALAARAAHLIDYAAACGAAGIVMCPLNDTAYRASDDERLGRLHEALTALRPMLETARVTGLVEPLGFAECSLRTKREAVDAIRAVGGEGTFKLVHDTFHHHVAGEAEFFPAMTGLVHISGVTDPAVGVERMRDPHRVLVDAHDRLDNVGQLRALLAGGYRGAVSFEPFAPSVHDSADVEADLRDSMALIAGEIDRPAA